jgi:hypothetical protein
MIRPIQRLPSVLLLLERLLKYTPITHTDHQQLTNAIDKLREVAKKLNEERGKTEKHLSLFSIVNSIDNCPVRLGFFFPGKLSFAFSARITCSTS